ncbi:hypothetical protein chiPu_0030375, partial [Chiloscyllium punctatum]|nr:hypothetical protein [Chiloscyllium punctatum]
RKLAQLQAAYHQLFLDYDQVMKRRGDQSSQVNWNVLSWLWDALTQLITHGQSVPGTQDRIEHRVTGFEISH